jgi:hypothetical protein
MFNNPMASMGFSLVPFVNFRTKLFIYQCFWVSRKNKQGDPKTGQKKASLSKKKEGIRNPLCFLLKIHSSH